MRSLRIGCLPVVDDNRLVGIVTEADLLHVVEDLPDAALPSPRQETRSEARSETR